MLKESYPIRVTRRFDFFSKIFKEFSLLLQHVVKLWDYNAKSLYQIIDGKYISTDDFIYFRCYLTSLGKTEFYKVLHNPELLKAAIDRSLWTGEEMMSVADYAYQKKSGTSGEMNCPKCVCTEVSYDFGSYKNDG